MVNILRKLRRAKWTGNWALHLEAISEMLPFMAASGHNLYKKLSRIYLQQMCKWNIRWNIQWNIQVSTRDLERDSVWSDVVIGLVGWPVQ